MRFARLLLASLIGLGSLAASGGPMNILGGGRYTPGQDGASNFSALIADSNVVWYHDFDSDDEVDAFRWTGGYMSGNDPDGNGGPQPNWAYRCASCGVDGGAAMEIIRTLQSGCGPSSCQEGSGWWRPFSPLNSPGNGRAANDPAANGTLTRSTWSVSDGSNTTGTWQNTTRPGWYGNADYHTGSAFDGTDFYIQIRVQSDPRRTTSGNSQVGKFSFITTTSASNVPQEVVTYSGAFGVAGGTNYHNMYGPGFNPLGDQAVPSRPGLQTNSVLANYGASQYCDYGDPTRRQYCWGYSGGWDTLLYHVTPGHASTANTRMEVWAAHEGDTSYTKIWDMFYSTGFQSGSQGGPFRNGWNAILLNTYNNGKPNSEFWHRYDRIIFSKGFIDVPVDAP